MTKLVSSLSSLKNGVIATATYDRFYVKLVVDSICITQGTVFRRDLVSSIYKFPPTIHEKLIRSVTTDDKNELYIDIIAKQLIDAICEANCAIF